MMYKTTGFTRFETKKKMSASLKLLQNSEWQIVTNAYQCDACGRGGFSDTIVPLSIPILVAASRRLSSSVASDIRFLFLHFTYFIVENVFSHVCISKHNFIAKSFSLRNLSLLTNFQKLQRCDLNAVY